MVSRKLAAFYIDVFKLDLVVGYLVLCSNR